MITDHDRYGDRGPGGGIVTFGGERGGVSNFGSALPPPHVNNEHYKVFYKPFGDKVT